MTGAAINLPGITIPAGILDPWYAYRTAGNTAGPRRDVVVFGDSTTFGSGGLYSWLQRIRDRSVADGYADGGKGMFAAQEDQIVYDAPEVNGISSFTFSGSTDGYDNLTGGYLYSGTTGQVLNLRFRSSGARLWYSRRSDVGTFTYSVDGASPVTVNAYTTGSFPPTGMVYLSGYDPSVTHTVQIVNGSAFCHIAFAPVNATGIAYQKQARSGATFQGFFGLLGTWTSPFTAAQNGSIYQTAMGLTPTSVQGSNSYAGATPDTTSYADNARIKPVLAMADLGFNDLTSAGGYDILAWVEYVRRFAAACRAASCPGIVLSGQLPYNANWPAYGATRFAALRDTAAAENLGFVDMFTPIGGPSLSYSSGTGNPHLTKPQYQAQADFLWDNLLGAAPPAQIPGSGWTPVVAERWNGSAWAPVVAEEWNGAAWAPSVLERAT